MVIASTVRTPVSVLLGFAVLAGCGGESHGPVSGSRALEHTARIVALSPRQPGSDGIRKVADYIGTQLGAIDPALRLERQPFEQFGLRFENLWVELPGADPNGPILAIAAHYDSKITHPGEQDFPFVGALDAAASCGVLIELARELHRARPIAANVWLIWLDGEESLEWQWADAKALIGSKHFAATMSADKARFPDGLSKRMRALVLLDLLGDVEMKIDRDLESNPKLLEIFGDTAKAMGVGEMMYGSESPMQDDHIPFKGYGVRVIDLIDFAFRPPEDPGRKARPDMAARYFPWWHTADDTLDKVSAESLGVAGNLVWNALPRIEREFYK